MSGGRQMLKSISRLRNMVTRPLHTYRPTTETFPNLDTHLIASEMELAAKGLSRGRENQPSSESQTTDQVENDIFEHVSAAQKRAHDSLENHLAGFRQRLVELDFDTQFSDIRAASMGGLSDLSQELQIGLDDLHEARRDLTAQEKAYAAFTAKNKLDRPAKVSSKAGTFFKVTLIIFLMLGEFVTNGTLLAEGNSFGLVGGILESIIFSGVNVGVAVFFGLYLIPNLNHRNIFRKFAGLLSFFAYLSVAVIINLGLAHYREVAITLQEGAGALVMERLFGRTLILDDFQSWILFTLGFLFSLIAMIDSLTLRDPYPGFSHRDKALRVARAAYADERREAIEALGEVRKEYEETLTAARAGLGKQRGEHDAIVAHRLRLISIFDEHQAQLEKAGNALLRVYRDANSSARETEVPKRFEEKFQLERISVSVASEGEWKDADLRARIVEAQGEIDKLFGRLSDEFASALRRYVELDIIVPENK